MELADYLAIPYVAVVSSVEKPNGEWVRRAEYPDLPGCSAEARDVMAAMDELERKRVQYVVRAYRQRGEIPMPHPPLQSGVSGLSETPVEWILTDIEAEGIDG